MRPVDATLHPNSHEFQHVFHMQRLYIKRLQLCFLMILGCMAAHAAPPSPTLAQRYHPGIDVTAYRVSEKYDGVRALWTGSQLQSRQGLPIRAPAWFTAGWPAEPLDGELWAGRGRFAAAQAAVAAGTPDDAQWRGLLCNARSKPLASPGCRRCRSGAWPAMAS